MYLLRFFDFAACSVRSSSRTLVRCCARARGVCRYQFRGLGPLAFLPWAGAPPDAKSDCAELCRRHPLDCTCGGSLLNSIRRPGYHLDRPCFCTGPRDLSSLSTGSRKISLLSPWPRNLSPRAIWALISHCLDAAQDVADSNLEAIMLSRGAFLRLEIGIWDSSL